MRSIIGVVNGRFTFATAVTIAVLGKTVWPQRSPHERCLTWSFWKAICPPSCKRRIEGGFPIAIDEDRENVFLPARLATEAMLAKPSQFVDQDVDCRFVEIDG